MPIRPFGFSGKIEGNADFFVMLYKLYELGELDCVRVYKDGNSMIGWYRWSYPVSPLHNLMMVNKDVKVVCHMEAKQMCKNKELMFSLGSVNLLSKQESDKRTPSDH